VRKFLIAVVLFIGVIFLITRFAEMENIAVVLGRGQIAFVGLAVLAQSLWMANLGRTYRDIYRLFDIPSETFYMMRLATAANFINVIAPAAGFSSMALFYSVARHRGYPFARVTIASVLFIWLEYIGILLSLVFGLGVLAQGDNLHWSEITASAILLAGALGLATLLYLGMRSADLLARVLAWGARTVNKALRPFLHRPYLSEERAHEFAYEAAEGIAALRHQPREILEVLLLTLSNKALLMVVLWLTFLAFRIPVSLGVVVAGFSICYLFLIVSPTPAGLGIVEGIMTVVLTSLGIPIGDATVVTLSFRGFTFWLPLLVGMVAFRTLHIKDAAGPP
jgi:glycosyltransferase 2 family protein